MYLLSPTHFHSLKQSSFPLPALRILMPKPEPITISKHRPDHFQIIIKSKMINPTPQPDPNAQNTRLEDIKQFDESKIGVKGLVGSGLTTIPSFFVHPILTDPNAQSTSPSDPKPTIHVIDFSSPRSTIVDQVRQASASLGFFQIINHSVLLDSIKEILDALKGFFELPKSIKMEYYRRDLSHGAAYSTNFDIYQSKASSWRDSFQVRLGSTPADREYVLENYWESLMEWDKQVFKIFDDLMGILCEELGLENPNKLKEISCLDARIFVGDYYPYCPQPELMTRLTSHTDPGVLTVLVQNEVPGLQVKVGEH